MKSLWDAVWALAAIKYVVMAVALIAILGWWLAWYPRDTVWGDVSTGVAAVGTVLTVGFAIVVTRTERADRLAERADRIQSQERLEQIQDEERENSRRAQASNVSWWTEPIDTAEPDLDLYAKYKAGTIDRDDIDDIAPVYTSLFVSLHILNSNEGALRSCSVEVGGTWGGTRYIGFLPPARGFTSSGPQVRQVVWPESRDCSLILRTEHL